jgi:hypothetical protein
MQISKAARLYALNVSSMNRALKKNIQDYEQMKSPPRNKSAKAGNNQSLDRQKEFLLQVLPSTISVSLVCGPFVSAFRFDYNTLLRSEVSQAHGNSLWVPTSPERVARSEAMLEETNQILGASTHHHFILSFM